MNALRRQHPLAFACGALVGAIVADLLLIGGDVFVYGMHWREQMRR